MISQVLISNTWILVLLGEQIHQFLIGPTRKHDLESLLYTLIYLFKSECPYGHLDQDFVATKLKMKHQDMKRNQFLDRAKYEGIKLSEYICKGIDIESSFLEFAEEIFNLGYDETPNYDNLISL